MLLYIIRHGEPGPDGALTSRGQLQAEAVGKRLATAGINRIFTSPILRAQQTALPACRLLNIDAGIEEWTHEIGDERLTSYPDGVMKSVSFVQNTHFRENGNMNLGYDRAFEAPGIAQSQMKEAIEYITRHGNEFLERLGYREENGVYRIIAPNEDRVALFCHSAFTRAWVSVLLHIPLNIMWAGFNYTHSGVTVLEFRNNSDGFTAPNCLCYSDMSHLLAEGLDMNYDGELPI